MDKQQDFCQGLYMQVTHAVDTDAPPYHHRGWFLHFLLVTVKMVFFIFGMKDLTSIFPQQQSKMRAGEHVSTVFRSMSDDFRPRELGCVYCTKLINAFLSA